MNEVIKVPRDKTAKPGWWLWRDRVMLCCPNGHLAMLDHEISLNGHVKPSVQCPQCDWHEHVKLEGYSDPADSNEFQSWGPLW